MTEPVLRAMLDPERDVVDMVANAMYTVIGAVDVDDPRMVQAEREGWAVLRSAAAVLVSQGIPHEADLDGILVGVDRWPDAAEALAAAGLPVQMEPRE